VEEATGENAAQEEERLFPTIRAATVVVKAARDILATLSKRGYHDAEVLARWKLGRWNMGHAVIPTKVGEGGWKSDEMERSRLVPGSRWKRAEDPLHRESEVHMVPYHIIIIFYYPCFVERAGASIFKENQKTPRTNTLK
jgi:hypothetical protein